MRCGAPIFVLGIRPRSGTNYLYDLLRRHPGCQPAVPIWEDGLLQHAHHLRRYVGEVHRAWDPAWGVEGAARAALLRALGDGLCGFLRDRCRNARPLTKTPCVDNLDLFPELFPEAQLIVLVRDGRAVVESGARSFRWHREAAIRAWDAGARRIRAFQEEHGAASPRHRVLHFESLCADPPGVLRELFSFLELDAGCYDFDAIPTLPVRGSSTLRSGAGGRMHWQPVPRPEGFDPIDRHAGWSPAQHDRFDWIAGESLARFGYASAAPGRRGPLSHLQHRMRDLVWLAVEPLKGFLGPIRRWLLHRISPQAVQDLPGGRRAD